jgi:hypothetical protein
VHLRQAIYIRTVTIADKHLYTMFSRHTGRYPPDSKTYAFLSKKHTRPPSHDRGVGASLVRMRLMQSRATCLKMPVRLRSSKGSVSFLGNLRLGCCFSWNRQSSTVMAARRVSFAWEGSRGMPLVQKKREVYSSTSTCIA